jgi:hypothetical protein
MFNDTYLVVLKRKYRSPRIINLESIHILDLESLHMLDLVVFVYLIL